MKMYLENSEILSLIEVKIKSIKMDAICKGQVNLCGLILYIKFNIPSRMDKDILFNIV